MELACAFVAAALVFVAACGDDPPAEQVQTATVDDEAPTSSPEDPTTQGTPQEPAAQETPSAIEETTTPSTSGLPGELLMLTGIDIAEVLQRACLGWSFLEYRDSGAINDAVAQFLYNAPAELRLDAFLAGPDSFNDLIRAACEHQDDPAQAWAVLTDGLGITNDDFSTLVDTAPVAAKQPAPRLQRDQDPRHLLHEPALLRRPCIRERRRAGRLHRLHPVRQPRALHHRRRGSDSAGSIPSPTPMPAPRPTATTPKAARRC